MKTVEDYARLIPSANADKPRFLATLAAVTGPLSDMQAALYGMIAAFDLNTAVGAQLDAVGERIGRSRFVDIDLSGYFSWDTDGLGWEEGYWQGPFDPDTGGAELDDDSYRLLLRARALANGWDGTLKQAEAIFGVLFIGMPYSVYIRDNQDMTATVSVVGAAPDPRTKALIQNGYLGLKPAGVSYSYVFPGV